MYLSTHFVTRLHYLSLQLTVFAVATAHSFLFRNPAAPVALTSDVPVWPPYDDATSPYFDISHDQISANQHFREPYMTFWTKIVPSLLQMDEDFWDESTCSSNCSSNDEKGPLFGVNMVVAENIMLTLSIMSGCLLFAVFLICAFAISRENSGEYHLKERTRLF